MALWDGTAQGSIHCIATDELCCTLKDKTLGNRIDDTTGGNSGVEPRLGVMYTETVVRRGYSLSALCRSGFQQCRKDHGALSAQRRGRPGSDADITILDPTRRGKVTAAELHETDYTPWEGHDIFAWPVTTMLRGKVMVENGQYLGKPGRRPLSQAQDRRKYSQRTRAMTTAVAPDTIRPDAAELCAVSDGMLGGLAVLGSVSRTGDGGVAISGGSQEIRIEPAPPDLPFRWMVIAGGRKRPGDLAGGGAASGSRHARSRLRGATGAGDARFRWCRT